MRTFIAGTREANNVRVFLNGEDVSRLCFEANVPDLPGVEAEGSLGLYCEKDGKKVVRRDYGGDPYVESEYKTGLVKWERIKQ